MKVLVITNMYPFNSSPFYGIFIAEQVKSLRNLGITVDVFFINGKKSKIEYLSSIFKLAKLIRKETFDLLHAHHTLGVYITYIAKKLSKKNNLPLILTLHEAEILNPRKFQTIDYSSELFSNIVRDIYIIKKIALAKVDFCIPVFKELLNKLDYKGTYEEIPCGIDINQFKPIDKNESRKILHLPTKEKIIFFPADPNRKLHKGFKLFDSASRLLRNMGIKFKVITGGKIIYEKMPYYYNASDLVVQTSLFEASPTVIKEAMACNMPIVSTDAGDTKKIFGGIPGYFICARNPRDVADKIKKGLNFGQVTEGRERIIKLGLSLNQTAQKLIRVYQSVLEKQK